MKLLKPIKRMLSKSFSKNPPQNVDKTDNTSEAENTSNFEKLLSQFPEDPYLKNGEFKAKCKLYEDGLDAGFVFVTRFNTFENNSTLNEKNFSRHSIGFSTYEVKRLLPEYKTIFLNYLLFCQKNNSKEPLFFIRQFTTKYPKSGVMWYALLQAVTLIKGNDKTTETSEEVMECLTNAAKYGCEYVKMNENGQLTIKALF